ncbi:MAG: glycosyltransferase family 4 protein [Elusimicrobia bacterium]|nr:glycosyltransferase family 4 protein [Candidatus Obscuribacterium magneticum]
MERHLDYLVELLQDMGHQPHVLTTAFPTGKNWSRCPVHVVDSSTSFFGPRWWIGSRRVFQSLHHKEPFDAILSEGFAAAPLGRLENRPPMAEFSQGLQAEHFINQWREFRTVKDVLQYIFIRVPENIALTAVDCYSSRSLTRFWGSAPHICRRHRLFYRIDSSKIELFHNWLDDRFTPAPDDREQRRSEWGAVPSDTVFLFNSVLSRQKGAHVALRAFLAMAEKHSNTHLVIVGDGPEFKTLKTFTERSAFSQRIHLWGHRPNTEIPGILSAADVFLLPTLRIEGLPYTAMESAWAGLPAIGTRCGGTPEALGESALYVRPGSIRDLTRAMILLAGNPEERRRRGETARRYAHLLFQKNTAREKLASFFSQINTKE